MSSANAVQTQGIKTLQPPPDVVTVPRSAVTKQLSASSKTAPAAPSETGTPELDEVVVKPIDLSGLWKVNSPKKVGMSVGLFSGVHINYSGETGDRDICELQQKGTALKSKCLRVYRLAEGSIDGNDVTLRWWLGPANMIFNASTADGTQMTGTLNGGALGKKVTAGVPVVATKLELPSGPAGDHDATLLRDVLQDVAAGSLTSGRYTADAVKRVAKTLPATRYEIAPLGPIQNIAYVAQILPRHPYDPTELPLDVYRVSYRAGAQLCGISVNESKVVTDFSCH